MDEIECKYPEDLEIARRLIARDPLVTRQFFYITCYPLFKSIFSRYYTDCESTLEFISEMYMLLLSRSAKTGRCQLQNYGGRSTLRYWISVACNHYCYSKFATKKNLDIVPTAQLIGDDETSADRFFENRASIEIDLNNIDRGDVEKLLSLMPNQGYSRLIKLKYIDQLSNEETAKILGLEMDNYYNSHLRAKRQFVDVLRKENSYDR